MILFLQLVLAHMLGDFFIQPGKWVRDKELRKWRSPYLYLHVLIHFVLILVICWNREMWKPAALVAVSHLLIDASKLSFQKDSTKRIWFFADQALHLLVIIAVWMTIENVSFDMGLLLNTPVLGRITAVLFLLYPASFIIRMVISKWSPDAIKGPAAHSLQNAGMWIGIMERLLVFVFILLGKWEGVGFLLAAKSVFRFGDLKEAKDMKLTEYVLIGTLLSFGLAIAAGLLVLKLGTVFKKLSSITIHANKMMNARKPITSSHIKRPLNGFNIIVAPAVT